MAKRVINPRTEHKKSAKKSAPLLVKKHPQITVVIIPQILMKLGELVFQLLSLPFFLYRHLRPKKRIKQTLKWLNRQIIKPRTIFVFAVLGLIIYSTFLIQIAAHLPSPDRLTTTRPLTTQIYDREGRLLYQFYEGHNRKLVALDTLPSYLINATVAVEDKNFFSHPGVDIEGIARALRNNLLTNTLQGGSTITQQLVKSALLNPDKTVQRKLQEIALAFWIERLYTKEEILQMYFNEVPYGGPAWGIQAASEMYFGKNSSELSLAESTYLAGLPAAPTDYSPYGAHPEKGKKRQKEVLKRMVKDGYLKEDVAEKAFLEELAFRSPTQNIKAPHFVMYIRSLLASKYGEKTVSQGGLQVTTTLDLEIQEMAEKVVFEEVNKLNKLKVGNGAAMVTDAQTGQILAMVGSKDYFDQREGNFNVTLALRQPGSSVKPITYVVGFEEGFTPGSILLDTPIAFKNPWGASYSPVNYDGKYHGAVTIRTALGSSFNVPAVKMLATVGVPKMVAKAKDMGITTLNEPDKYGLSLTLGGGAIKMVDMMTVYGTFASGGIKHEVTPFLKVTDSFGNVLEDHSRNPGKRVLTEEVAYLISHILADNQARIPAFGANSLLVIPNHTVAVKTGTSDDKRDNLAFGFTPKYVVGTWVGNNDNSPMDPKLTSGVTGATPIWHEIMKALVNQEPNLAFTKPKGIIEISLNGKKELGIRGTKDRTVTLLKKIKQKDSVTGEEKEVLSYSDPFGTYTPN